MASPRRIALWIVLGAGAIRLALAAVIQPFPDETYYWDWSRHLAPGTINLRLGAVRRLAYEAADCGL